MVCETSRCIDLLWETLHHQRCVLSVASCSLEDRTGSRYIENTCLIVLLPAYGFIHNISASFKRQNQQCFLRYSAFLTPSRSPSGTSCCSVLRLMEKLQCGT